MDDLRAVIHEIGAFLIATATLTVLWELIGKRAFLDEVLEKAGITQELSFAGIHRITQGFYDAKVDWDFFFQHSRYMDIFFAYAQTWRRVYGERVREFAQRPGNKIRVVMPDPTHAETMAELARRFEYATADLIQRIQDSEAFLLSLRKGNGENVEIRFVRRGPLFSFYIFDQAAIIAFYSHRGLAPVPTFVVAHGSLYKFVRDEFDALVQQSATPAAPRLLPRATAAVTTTDAAPSRGHPPTPVNP